MTTVEGAVKSIAFFKEKQTMSFHHFESLAATLVSLSKPIQGGSDAKDQVLLKISAIMWPQAFHSSSSMSLHSKLVVLYKIGMRLCDM